ncbi:MAG: iron ABC transporter permease [Candidatus Obscuribacterales bacterium]|nr:iron ABC transporter permease [Candidatus Obscuribacterales bacterium]
MKGLLFFRFLLLAAALIGILLLNLCLGEVNFSLGEVLRLILDFIQKQNSTESTMAILMDIRLPRALAACLVGASLGISGYQLQALSNNGLADPYLTGVSSGAGLAVTIAIVLGVDFAFIPALSLAGGLAASTVVLLLSKSNEKISVSRLLLCGVALSAFCGAIITMLICSGQGSVRTQGIYYWLAGSVSGKSWTEISSAGVYIAAGVVLALLTSKPLRLLSLGSSTAQSLGLEVLKAQIAVLFSAILLCSASVSLSGIVGFAGLVAPYFARQFFGRDERSHIISSAGIGACLVLLSDLAARCLSGGQEPPLGTLLSLIGGPFFLYLLYKRSEGVYRL